MSIKPEDAGDHKAGLLFHAHSWYQSQCWLWASWLKRLSNVEIREKVISFGADC